jgi:iron complex outermembrane receptor protein
MTPVSSSTRIAVFSSLLLAGAAIPQVAYAQDAATAAASDNGLAEIVVTASKRGAESLQSVPIAIQALTGETLAAKGANSFADFAGSVPSLQFNDLGPGDKKYIIRGVSSTGASTVGVYYDEAVITAANSNDGGGRNADIRLYDLERIEVLKGPQGTLYGASSMSGTIRFITAKPKMTDFEGNVTGEVSSTKKGGTNYNLHGTLNLPIVNDVLAIRATGWLDDQSGYIDAVRIPSGRIKDINNDNTKGGRVIARLTPNSDLTITASATVQRTHSDGSSRYTPAGTNSYGDAANGFPSVPGGDLINTDLTQSPLSDKLHIYSLTGDYRTGIGTFTATTNWYDRSFDFSFDSTPILFANGVPIPGITHQPQYRRVWSNELRYASDFEGPLNVVVGGFLQREKSDFTVEVIRSNAFGLARGPFNPANSDDALANPDGNTFFGRTDDQLLKQEALFGELTFKPIDKLTGVVGARYFHSRQSAAQQTTHPFGGFAPGSQTDLVLFNQSTDHKVTYKFNLSYQADRNMLIYATAAQGFRVGGVNPANLPFTSNIPRGYTPDTLWNYEAGFKSELFDRRLRFNVAAYTIRWSDTQVRAVDATGSFPFTTNAGKVRINGIEAEADGRLAPGLQLSVGGSYQTAKLRQDQPFIPGNPNLGLNGDTLPNVPKFQANASLSYDFPLAGDFTETLRADFNYRAKTQTQFNNNSPFNVPLDSYTLLNLRATTHTGDWAVALFVNNLFDKRAQIDAISSTQDPLARLTIRPRTIGASATRSF